MESEFPGPLWESTLTRVVMAKTRAALADVQNVPDSDLNPKRHTTVRTKYTLHPKP